MVMAIQLYAEMNKWTIKIKNVGAYGVLATEFHA